MLDQHDGDAACADARRTSIIAAVSVGLRPAQGSSASSRSARVAMARATSRCRSCPTVKHARRLLGEGCDAGEVERLRGRGGHVARAGLAEQRADADVLGDAEVAERTGDLEGAGDAELGDAVGRQAGDAAAP